MLLLVQVCSLPCAGRQVCDKAGFVILFGLELGPPRHLMTLVSPRTVGMVGSACAPVAEGTVPLLHLLVSGRIVLLHCERPSRFLKH